jgi:hypothetical protein
MSAVKIVVSFLMFPTVAVDVVHVHSIGGQLSYVSHFCSRYGSCAFYLWSAFLCFSLFQWMWFMCILFVVSFLMFPTMAVVVVHLHSICCQLPYVFHCGSGCGSSAFYLWTAFLCFPLWQWMWFICILFVVSCLMFPTVAGDVVHLHSICDQLSYVSHCDSGCGSCAFYLWSAFLRFPL